MEVSTRRKCLRAMSILVVLWNPPTGVNFRTTRGEDPYGVCLATAFAPTQQNRPESGRGDKTAEDGRPGARSDGNRGNGSHTPRRRTMSDHRAALGPMCDEDVP
jgi:hypothetical protein